MEVEARGSYFRSTLIRVFEGLKTGGSTFSFSFLVLGVFVHGMKCWWER